MLLRLVNHHINNKIMVDKLISLVGFPEDMFYTMRQGICTLEELGEDGKNKKEVVKGLVIKEPFEADVSDNLPDLIIEKFAEEKEIWDVYGKEFLGKRSVYGLKLDYSTGPGEIAWAKIERAIEESTGRFERVVEPAPVGNERAWTLNADDVPEFVLKPLPKEESAVAVKESRMDQVMEPKEPQIHCDQCDYKSDKKQAIRMHKMKKHNSNRPRALAGV
jgi:hypothetical protein